MQYSLKQVSYVCRKTHNPWVSAGAYWSKCQPLFRNHWCPICCPSPLILLTLGTWWTEWLTIARILVSIKTFYSSLAESCQKHCPIIEPKCDKTFLRHMSGKCQCNMTFDFKINLGYSDLISRSSDFSSFIFCSEKHFSFIGKAQFRRATLSCDSSYFSLKLVK